MSDRLIVKVVFFSVLPSPYQRDLFGAIAVHSGVDLRVYYLEEEAPDSPWGRQPLRPFEEVLPGFWLPLLGDRCHFNWALPAIHDADLVVVNTMISFTSQWLMRKALRGRRWMFWGERLGDGLHSWKRWLREQLVEPLNRAAAIVGIGSRACDVYQKRFPLKTVFNIPYHCDLQPFLALEKQRRTDDAVTIFFCGQMIYRKGVDLLLEAFGRLVQEGMNVRLLLVGRQGELNGMLDGLSQGARARVDYRGFKAPDELPVLFLEADIFVLPSRCEGWGVVVNQALGTGLPVVCTDAVGAGYDLVEEGMNGFHVPSCNVQALYDAVKKLVLEGDIRRQMGEASRRKALEWTPEKGAQKWVEAIKSFIH